MRPTEYQESLTLVEYLEYRRVKYIHVPNEGKMSRITGRRLNRIGRQKGFPDYLIFSLPEHLRDYKGIAIELKRQGGRLTKGQERWLATLRKLGWITRACQGAGDAIAWLQSLGV